MRRLTTIAVAAATLVALASGLCAAQGSLRIWPHTRALFMELAEEFKNAHPEIEVEIQSAGAHDNDKLGAAIAAGIGPDVSTSVRINRYFAGWVVPLNDYFEKSDVAKEYLANMSLGARILQQAAEAYSFDGQITALATAWTYPVWGLYQNREMFELAGVPVFPPDVAPTWEEIAIAHQKLTRVDGSGMITQLGFPAHHDHLHGPALAESFGIPFIAPDGGPEFEGLIRAYTFLYDNFVRSLGYENILAYMPNAGDELPVTSGLAAMAIAPARGQGDLGGKDLVVSFAPHVSGERIAYVAGMFWQLNAPLRNPEAAYKFLDFTIQNLDWHEASLLQEGRMGAPGFDQITRLLPMVEEVNPVGAWFLMSMATADRLVFLPPTVPWENDFYQVMGDEEGRIIDIWSGRLPVRAVMEEVEQIVRARYQESPWYR